ncbi:MAG: DEAD/DEAH box helicase [Firmicutes bacterium]|nr:DEAD/DEAH box helicase [Bacillota bacterium]
MENKGFNQLELSDSVQRAIEDMGFEEPSKIQMDAIPLLLEGFDLIGQAQTGTGKTLAFGASILSMNNKDEKGVYCLIVTPTRELAIQVNDELVRIAKYSNIKLLPVYGGQPIERQITALRRGIDIVVGTPGRLLDLIRRKAINLSKVHFVVLDEADEMLDMGFIEDIEEILKNTNEDHQTMLFSATMPDPIKKLAKRYLRPDAKTITMAKKIMTVSSISQYYYEIKQQDRFESLCRILDVDEPSSAIIFCKTKKGVDEVVESMQARGYNVEGMHGDMNQNQRINTLRKFKEGSLEFLVATDVAARGIDVENISHVINYDFPQDIESYVHRIGRTGRANKEGTAYSLVTSREYVSIKQIERVTGSKIKRKDIPTIDDIFHAKYRSMIKSVKETLEKEDYKRFVPLATELDEEYNLVDVAAALMHTVYQMKVSYDYVENNIGTSTGFTRMFISVGRIDKVNPKSLLHFLNDIVDIDKEYLGEIDIYDKFSFIDVRDVKVKSLIKGCSGKKLNGRKVRVEISTPK